MTARIPQNKKSKTKAVPTASVDSSQIGKVLVIAEKPSVARDITRALGGFQSTKDFFESADFVVTSAVGHLLEMVVPEGTEVKRGKWSLVNLPVIPDHFEMQPIEKGSASARNKAQLRLINNLYVRDDVHAVINACDAGREGELIFHFLIRYFKGAKPVRRLWLQSMTPQAIRDGFNNLRDGHALLPLQRAAVCRAESDWLIGINATRAMTALNSGGGGFHLTTVGRVQTPTLAILVDREKEIQTFEPRDYWEINATFAIASGQYDGRWINAQMQQQAKAKKKDAGRAPRDLHGTSRVERIWESQQAETIVAKCAGQQGLVSEVTKPATQQSPPLFDLTSLQREANQRFGFSARATLAIAQALYDRHKVLTYPRTDSRALPEDYPPTVKKIMKSLTQLQGGVQASNAAGGTDAPRKDVPPISHWATEALDKNYIQSDNKRIFNNARVSDHFAIIPTGELPRNLKEQERRIYELVTRRFIAVFYPPARFEKTVRTTVVQEETFETKGQVLIESGWLQVMGREESSETLPPLAVNDDESEPATTVEIEQENKQTRPPPRYSEATLLSAMEGAGKQMDDDEMREAMRERGLGTPATRASIIEQLIHTSHAYILRDGRELVPTPKASTLLRLLRALKIDELTRAELTGEWEKRLKQIESDTFSSTEFMQHIRQMTSSIVEAARACDVDQIPGEYDQLQTPCPKCGGTMRENYRKFACEAGACDFSVWKSVAGREWSIDEMNSLLSARRIGPLDGFRSRLGRPFSAEVIIKDDFSIAFDFGEAEEKGLDPQTCEQLGVACPKCGAPVLITPRRYLCMHAIGDATTCDFSFSRAILNRPMQDDEVRMLLSEGKTELLQGFVSKRTRRPFSAHLTMDLNNKSGKLGFEFAARKGEVKDTEAGAKVNATVAKDAEATEAKPAKVKKSPVKRRPAKRA